MTYKGVDVSAFSGLIDWDKAVSSSKIDFVMLKASYGKYDKDNFFKENIENIIKNNIPAGAYHCVYADDVGQVMEEAKNFIDTISKYNLNYPVALKMDENSIKSLGKEKTSSIIRVFIDHLKYANYYPILYLKEEFINKYIELNKIPSVDIWISKFDSKPLFNKNVGIWQMSNSGIIDGIGKNINMNISYKDYKTIIENYGFNKFNNIDLNKMYSKNNEFNCNENNSNNLNNNEKKDYIEYRVKYGDSLWTIANKFLGDGHKYRQIMNENKLPDDTIYLGQILKIPVGVSDKWNLYTVKRGDSLYSISAKFLNDGNRYTELKKINNLSNDQIYAGQILKIPNNKNIDNKNNNNNKNAKYYTVNNKDTLAEISLNFLGNMSRYPEIMKLNNLKSTVIKPGQILRIY